MELRRRGLVDLLSVVHPQHQLVGKPVGEEVHGAADHERDQHPLLPADGAAQHPEQGNNARHQDARLEPVAEHAFLRISAVRLTATG
jgi:hypothetical protein